MSIYSTSNINSSYVKVRWQEPYVSSALNTKMFGVLPKGIYSGFVIGPGGLSNRSIAINTGSVSGGLGTGLQGGYVSGNFDETVTYSIAVHQNSSGWATTVSLQPGSLPAYLDATGLNGQTVYIVLDVQYSTNNVTTANFYLCNAAQIDANPSYIVIGYCQVPSNPSTPLTLANFGYNDPNYPRLTPLATPQKAGFMPTSAWSAIAANQMFAWQSLLSFNVDPNSTYVVDIYPSQTVNGLNNSTIYTYVQPNIASKFPRSSAGLYNGGALNNNYATLGFTTGTIGGGHQITGNTTFAIPSVSGTANAFQVGIVALDSGDNISVSYGNIYTTKANAVLDDNLPVVGSSLLQICGVVIQTDASGVIQPFTTSSFLDRRPFINIGGSGSSSSGAGVAPASGYMAVMSSSFSTPESTDTQLDTTKTNAIQNVAQQIYAMSCDKTKTFSTSGTAYTISSTPSYTVKAGDIIYASGVFRRIAAIGSQVSGTLDIAFPSNLSSVSGMVSEAVWTNDLVNVGSSSQNTRPRDFFPAVTIPSINVDYHDTLSVADGVPDYISTARVVVSASNSGLQSDTGTPTADTFASIFTRPTAVYPNNQVSNYALLANTNTQRLFMCFFPNPNNSSVTTLANLTDYKVSFYSQSTTSNGGYLQSAYCMSDGSGTQVNCAAPFLLTGLTNIQLTWNFVPNLNSGQTTGDVTVLVDGQVIPRFVSGVTLNAFYTEVPGTTNQIQLWANLSTYQRSIEIRRQQGSIDSSSQNSLILSAMNDLTVGTAAQVTAGSAQYSSLNSAIAALPSGGKIRVVGNPISENISITNASTMIEGKGRTTQITGTVSFVSGANYCILKDLRVTGNITMSSNYSYCRELFLAAGSSITISGGTVGNDAEYMPNS